jgi:GntR family transcriptional regulator/MocR family aminotransferase
LRAIHFKIPRGQEPQYLRIAEGIREAMAIGRLKPGDKIPSTRELAKSLRVHRNTIIAALNELVAEGWITGEQRKTYVVSKDLPTDFFQAKPRKGQAAAASKTFEWKLARRVELARFTPAGPVRYAFRWGFPDLSRFPYREFRSHLSDSLRRPRAELFDYGSPHGFTPLISTLEEYLRRIRGISDRSIFITNGSGEGIYLLAQLLIKPGDCVAMEELSYPPARELFRVLGAEIVNIPMEADGISLTDLEKVAARRRIKLLFLTPLHQFPTTVTLSVPKRLKLYQIASEYDFGIIEDDYDHEFHYDAQPLLPMAGQDPEERVLYAGTFSKVLFPSARIGFLAVPKALAPALAQYRRLLTHQNDAIMQDAIARWMSSGGLERHLRRMRRHYEEQRNVLVDSLQKAKEGGARIDWKTPEGGMALWLNTYQDSRAFAENALKLGAFVSPESIYRATSGPATHVRMGFSSPSSTDIRQGVETMSRLFLKRR